MASDLDIARFRSELDQKGEQEVRNILARDGWNEWRTAAAKAWLAEQENSIANTRYREMLDANQSAGRAAWVSAVAAVLALAVSLIALLRTIPAP